MTKVINASSGEMCSIGLPAWLADRFDLPTETERFTLGGVEVCGGTGTVRNEHGRRWVVAGVDIACEGMDASQLLDVTRRSMGWLRDALRVSDTDHPVRIWNFLPRIHEEVGGLLALTQEGVDMYRAFNMGRYLGFCDWFGGSGQFGRLLPTATGVGHSGGVLRMIALGCSAPGEAVDNPRQTPAFAYSTRFGPRPPCFARATCSLLPDGPHLLVGGTASVRGEESVHEKSLPDQWLETAANFVALFENARSYGTFGWEGVRHARAYVRHEDDLPFVQKALEAVTPRGSTREFVRADICRSELLVEIELLVADAGASNG